MDAITIEQAAEAREILNNLEATPIVGGWISLRIVKKLLKPLVYKDVEYELSILGKTDGCIVNIDDLVRVLSKLNERNS